MSRERKDCISILVDKIFIFNFSRHHDQSFDKGRHSLNIEALVIWKQHAETNQAFDITRYSSQRIDWVNYPLYGF